jgi:hypothetical protein
MGTTAALSQLLFNLIHRLSRGAPKYFHHGRLELAEHMARAAGARLETSHYDLGVN